MIFTFSGLFSRHFWLCSLSLIFLSSGVTLSLFLWGLVKRSLSARFILLNSVNSLFFCFSSSIRPISDINSRIPKPLSWRFHSLKSLFSTNFRKNALPHLAHLYLSLFSRNTRSYEQFGQRGILITSPQDFYSHVLHICESKKL